MVDDESRPEHEHLSGQGDSSYFIHFTCENFFKQFLFSIFFDSCRYPDLPSIAGHPGLVDVLAQPAVRVLDLLLVCKYLRSEQTARLSRSQHLPVPPSLRGGRRCRPFGWERHITITITMIFIYVAANLISLEKNGFSVAYFT